MKRTMIFNVAVVAGAMLLSNSVFAYSNDEEEMICKLPKILDFTLPEYSQPERLEVEPEAEFSFKVTGAALPEKIKVAIKGTPLKVELSSNTSFILVKGKLPAELTGKYARIDVFAGTDLGCRAKDGWLVKIKG